MRQRPGSESRGNALLEAFPSALRQDIEIIDEQSESHAVLIDGDEAPEWMYFPHRGTVISLTRTTDTGTTVEVGIVGSEGVASVQALLSPNVSGSDGVVQIAGGLSRARTRDIRRALNDDAIARDALHAFAGAFLTQVSQHVLCNRVHSIEERLSKWLLGMHDRIDTDEIGLTHDLISHMIGIRRSGVTIAIGALALDGLVTHSRNSITIIDRDGLEARACECYGVMARATGSLYGRA